MNRHGYRVGLGVALALASTLALASANKVGQILEQQREIREQTEGSTGDYARFEPRALARIEAAQDQIFSLLDGVSAVEQLHPDQQAELFNALEEVKAVLADNEDDRQHCWRERKLGTTMKETRCATVAEMRAVQEDTRNYLNRGQRCGASATSDCGSGRGLESATGR
ncbi:hypothetical protein [Marilutibacter aestuarii]|uniref:Lysozyme inhibitor LprI N-terminal domain-containing protein n=1 Tax=Marilutibacter aestuarii TaxID=1706195 RepID=A0A507ZX02_9GAMM|nr:hypothetical protein [Lysobacter aestuarii]TQD41013.1 hypothetical protein FKV25_13740 [Lysobacter aestuarii]